eukprot:7215016-Prymnesium_polylepis.1
MAAAAASAEVGAAEVAEAAEAAGAAAPRSTALSPPMAAVSPETWKGGCAIGRLHMPNARPHEEHRRA